jgi:flagellar basal-body rod modification protein FlgD
MAVITPATASHPTGTKAVINSGDTKTDSKTSDAQKKADDLQKQFLNILLTQLKNQNPLDPMDTKEFTGQLAQFSSLEQQINTNVKLDTLLDSIQNNAASSAFTYIGKEADIASSMTTYQNGSADWTYELPTNAKKVTIKVLDSSGNVLHQQSMSNVTSGSYGLQVNASDLNPPPAEGSVLTLSIDAVGADEKAIEAAISTTVMIDGVETGENGVDMRAGGLLFGLNDISKIRTPQPTPAV